MKTTIRMVFEVLSQLVDLNHSGRRDFAEFQMPFNFRLNFKFFAPHFVSLKWFALLRIAVGLY